MLLTALGHVCRSAMSGGEALAEAARFQPDVVICDIGLPDISGYEVARALRSRHGSRMYLAALTGWAQSADRARSFAAGFDQHLIKPASGRVLHAVIAASTWNIAIGTGEFPIVDSSDENPPAPDALLTSSDELPDELPRSSDDCPRGRPHRA